ncbi:hypothetical protein MESS4_280079 [Mesorhizobium sp. STM 4661]|nr:hypothetical protein MESS4_280079 [Mesorhizobium sp. STM 4661]
MQADRELMHEWLAVGGCHIDRDHLAVGKGLHRCVKRLRDAEPARKQVHGAGGQYGKRLLPAHQPRCRGRNGAVAATGQHNVDAAFGSDAVQGRDDVLAGNDVDIDGVTSGLQRPAHLVRKGGKIGGPQGAAVPVQHRCKSHSPLHFYRLRRATRQASHRLERGGLKKVPQPLTKSKSKFYRADAGLGLIQRILHDNVFSEQQRAHDVVNM